jgi:hypothetical protein
MLEITFILLGGFVGIAALGTGYVWSLEGRTTRGLTLSLTGVLCLIICAEYASQRGFL